MRKIINYLAADLRGLSFYSMVFVSLFTLVTFQNCGKVKFSRQQADALIPQSCGTISMLPANGLYPATDVTFAVVPPSGSTVSSVSWDFTKGSTSIFTSSLNPVVHSFDAANEGPGDYTATATFIKNDGNGCELAKSFQVLIGDLCAEPTGISGPLTGFVDEETSPFSVNAELCFQGIATWDFDGDGTPEFTNIPADSEVTHTYTTPGTYTVRVVVTNSDDGSQTTHTHTIVVNYANCTNGATNPPACTTCPAGQILAGGQCVNACTNGANNPPLCNQCPTGQSFVSGQCVNNCTNGATNPPACNQCPTGQSLVGGQCVSACTNGATNPPTCTTCPTGQSLVGGQCVGTCANGATNPPACTTCPAGKVLVGGQCINNCTNGANNPPACNQCPTGQSLVAGQCVNNCTNGANNPPACNQCPTGQILVGGQCTVPQNCTLDGVTVNHGQSRSFYNVTQVACGQTCSSVQRTCNNGVLSGNTAYNRANCLEASCGYAWSVGNWSTCSAVTCGTGGTQTRSVTCQRTDGATVSDSLCSATKPTTSQACSAPACNACALPWGGAIAHGQAVNAYQASAVACGQSCAVQSRSCNNGTLSGSFTNQACSVAACPVNGACGSANGVTTTAAPTANLCSSGSASAVATGTSNYTWSCSGANGGSTASCSAPKQHYSTASCGFGLVASGWSTEAGQPTSAYGSCEWAGWIYLNSSNKVNVTFFIADYYDTSGPYGIHRLTNPDDWTITATGGCVFNTLPDPKNIRKSMPNYCQVQAYTVYGGYPITWRATITAVNKKTGETRVQPITAVFKPTLTGPGGTPLPGSNGTTGTNGTNGSNGGNGGGGIGGGGNNGSNVNQQIQ